MLVLVKIIGWILQLILIVSIYVAPLSVIFSIWRLIY